MDRRRTVVTAVKFQCIGVMSAGRRVVISDGPVFSRQQTYGYATKARAAIAPLSEKLRLLFSQARIAMAPGRRDIALRRSSDRDCKGSEVHSPVKALDLARMQQADNTNTLRQLGIGSNSTAGFVESSGETCAASPLPAPEPEAEGCVTLREQMKPAVAEAREPQTERSCVPLLTAP